MHTENDPISARQYGWLFLAHFFSAGLLLRLVAPAEAAGADVWLAALLGLPVFLLTQFVLIAVMRKYPGQTLPQIVETIFGVLIGKALLAAYTLYYLGELAISSTMLGRSTQQLLLRHTPIAVIMLSTLVLAAYLARHGLGPLVRYVEFTTPGLSLFFVLVAGVALTKADFTHLLPVLAHGVKGVFNAMLDFLFRAIGLELLFFMYPSIGDNDKVTGTAALVMIARASLIIFLNTITIAVLGLRETLREVWPLVAVVKSVELTTVGVERVDSVFSAVWIATSFSVIAARIFFLSYILAKLINARTHKFLVWAAVPVALLLSSFPKDPPQFFQQYKAFSFVSGLMLIGLPWIIWVFSLFQPAKRRQARA